ncbi:hypothetical protein KUTeg_006912 [Tegillarca granosa]|uniref:DOMON domain-containing protein n=1 Tax=Tegillarca granosa TaxID=220873 RepID=A0ABQ9FE35_TEGGR|nr:hypothetical protein KUTeg_006912 [Tegillarca granosa]
MWTFDEKTDMITFQIDAAIEENQWLGLGLSKDTAMIKTDIYTGWYTNGVAYIQDRYASAKREPPIDQTQNIFNISASRNNGRTFLTFSRKRNTDDSSDEAFSDTECLYPLFAWGPVTSLSSLSIGYHSFRYNGVTEKLCIKSCSPQTSTTKPVPEPEKTTIAPAPEPEKSTTKPEPEPSLCTGKVSACPSGQCVAHLMWTFDEKTDMITFQIDAAIEENQWLGLGLSKDTSMTNTDIYTGWYTNGVTNVQDRYASAKREPPIDAIQNIFNVSGKRENGRTFLTFSRQRNTGDSSDEIFSDTQCLYPLFAWGPVTSFSSRTIGYHAFRYNGVTEKLCIKSCSNVSPEPEKPTSEPETTGEPEGEGEPGSCGAPPRGFNDTTGDSPHPMDCVDMVIGSAKGQLSRIGDYYSRDRSTPQKDEFYGGKDDLTAAYGFEDSNGYTTIMFRKKLRADERSDFSFLNEYMHVIWARGQEPGKFHHLPNVGLAENELSSFYKHDELKYHGHGGQRGIRRINFLDEPSGPVVGNCTQTWRNPSDNTHEVTWQYDSTTDSVQFTLKARLLQRQWIGVGISRDTFMPNTDTIVGWVNDDKTVTLIDGWASGRSVPATDTVQDVQGVRGTIENGITTISFNRRRDTQDQNDIAFSQNECVHLIYAKGGDYAVETGRFGYHDTTPIVSSGKICIPCPTVRPVEKFWVPYVFKLLGLLWQEVYNDANSAEFKKLKSDMESSLKNKFQRVNGFQKALVQKFSPGSINVNGVVEIQSDDQLQSKTEVSTELQNIVQEGRLSGYTVDSTQGSYKVGDPEPVKEVTAAPPSTDEKPILTETVWIIIGVGAGGLLLVLILGTCNCIRIHKNKKTQYTDERTKMYRNGFFQNDQSSSQEEPAKSDSMKYMDWRNMTHDMSQNQGPRTQNHYENPSYMPDVQTGKPPSYYYGYKIETYVNNE